MPIPEKQPRRRRWWQFSLFSMIVMVAMISISIGAMRCAAQEPDTQAANFWVIVSINLVGATLGVFAVVFAMGDDLLNIFVGMGGGFACIWILVVIWLVVAPLIITSPF